MQEKTKLFILAIINYSSQFNTISYFFSQLLYCFFSYTTPLDQYINKSEDSVFSINSTMNINTLIQVELELKSSVQYERLRSRRENLHWTTVMGPISYGHRNNPLHCSLYSAPDSVRSGLAHNRVQIRAQAFNFYGEVSLRRNEMGVRFERSPYRPRPNRGLMYRTQTQLQRFRWTWPSSEPKSFFRSGLHWTQPIFDLRCASWGAESLSNWHGLELDAWLSRPLSRVTQALCLTQLV